MQYDPETGKIDIQYDTYVYISPGGCINFHQFDPYADPEIDDTVHICGKDWHALVDVINSTVADNAARG